MKDFRLRLTFLAKFAILTSILAVALSAAMSSFLIDRHRQRLELDEGVTAAGQVSAALTETLGSLSRIPPGQRVGALRSATDAALQIHNVAQVSIYDARGNAIYPQSAPQRIADVRKTLDASNLWTRKQTANGSSVSTEFLPFFIDDQSYVVAIELYDVATSAQMSAEREDVVEATGAGVAIIFLSLGILAAGASREIEVRRRQSEQTFSQTLGVLAETIDRRDPYTAGHSRRVADYSRAMAEHMGLSLREQVVIEHGAMLHDLGKIGIPDAVLLKPGKLDDAEYAVMRQHPTIGASILGSIASMEDVTTCVLHHHERLDGNGYPHGLVGNAIPFGARTIAVADAFDAMTTDRPYRRGLSIEVAVTELRECAGRQFDRRCVEALAELVALGAIVPPVPARADETPQFGQRVTVELKLQSAS